MSDGNRTGTRRPRLEIDQTTPQRSLDHRLMSTALGLKRGAIKLWLEVGDRIDRNAVDHYRRPEVAEPGTKGDLGTHQRTEAHPYRGVVVAGNQDHGGNFDQAGEPIAKQLDCRYGWQRTVIDVAGHQNRIDMLIPGQLRKPLEKSRLGRTEIGTVKLTAQMPVSGMDKAKGTHTESP